VAGEDDVTQTNFDFQEIECSESTNKFIATPYTQSENADGAFRSPFTGHYEPGKVAEQAAIADHPKFKDIERVVKFVNI
jgi:hypothetical protein